MNISLLSNTVYIKYWGIRTSLKEVGYLFKLACFMVEFSKLAMHMDSADYFGFTPHRAATTQSSGATEPHSTKLTFSMDLKAFAFWVERRLQKAELAKERYKHGKKTGRATCVLGFQWRSWI